MLNETAAKQPKIVTSQPKLHKYEKPVSVKLRCIQPNFWHLNPMRGKEATKSGVNQPKAPQNRPSCGKPTMLQPLVQNQIHCAARIKFKSGPERDYVRQLASAVGPLYFSHYKIYVSHRAFIQPHSELQNSRARSGVWTRQNILSFCVRWIMSFTDP